MWQEVSKLDALSFPSGMDDSHVLRHEGGLIIGCCSAAPLVASWQVPLGVTSLMQMTTILQPT